MVVKIGVSAAVVIVAVLSFLFVRTSDEVVPVGTRTTLTIWDVGDVDRDDVLGVLEQSTSEHGVEIVKMLESTASASGTTTRELFALDAAVVGREGSRLSPHPDFGRRIRTRWVDIAELSSTNVQGTYVSRADEVALRPVADDLAARGMDVSTKSIGATSLVIWALYAVPFVPLAAGAVACLGAAVVHRSSTRRRAAALVLTQGMSGAADAVRVLRDDVRLVVVGTAIVLLASVPVLAAYNGMAQWPRFAGTVVIAEAGLCVGLASIGALVAAATRMRDVEGALLGRRPSRRSAVASVSGHALASGLVVVVLGAGSVAAVGAAAGSLDRESWSHALEWHRLAFFSTNDELSRSEQSFAAVARHEAAAGELLVAVSPSYVHAGHGPYEGNSLTVSADFLDDQTVLDQAGRPIRPPQLDPGALTLLVPRSVSEDGGPWRAQWADWLEWELSDHGGSPRPDVDPPVNVLVIADGQSVFTYGTAWGEESSHQRDAVVAVLPTAVDVVSDGWLASNMTSGGVLFSDPASVQRQLDAAGLDEQIGSIDRAADVAAVRIAEQSRELRDVLAVAALALVVVVLSAVMTGAALAERGRRRDVVLLTAGAGPFRTVLLPAVLTGSVVAAVVAAVQALGLVEGAGAVVAGAGAAVVVIDVVVISAVLAVHRSRIRADTLDRP